MANLHLGYSKRVNGHGILKVSTAVYGVVEPDTVHNEKNPIGLEAPKNGRPPTLLALLHHHLTGLPQERGRIDRNLARNGVGRNSTDCLGPHLLTCWHRCRNDHLREVDRCSCKLDLHVEVGFRHGHRTRAKAQAANLQCVSLSNQAVQVQTAFQIGHSRCPCFVPDDCGRNGVAILILNLEDLTRRPDREEQQNQNPTQQQARPQRLNP